MSPCHFVRSTNLFLYAAGRGKGEDAKMYEWIPTSIVAATFLIGLVAESVEAGRLQALTARVRPP